MGFIDAYKRLEKLCGEILNDDRRVSAYIDEMLNTPRGSYFVKGWEEDLKQLKHYRWIRNQIVHDPNCFEENMCNDDDTQWLVSFYLRIMNQTDPLALYRQATKPKPTPVKKADGQHYTESYNNHNQNARNLSGSGIAWLIMAVIVTVIAIWWLLK